MKNLRLLFLLSALAISAMCRAVAYDVVFVVDDDKDSTHIEWLEAQGFSVTEYWPADGLSNAPKGEIEMLNAADLVIVGRSAPSSAFDSPDKEYWNALKSPQVMVSPYDVRSSRSNWFNSSSAVHHNESPDTIWAAVQMASDPVFAGVTLVGDSMDYTIKPHDVLLHPDSIETNGTILATWGDNVMMARFDPYVEFYPGAADMPAGYRSYFGFGNDNVNDFANFFPLTDNAKTVYLAELNRMLATPESPKHIGFVVHDDRDSSHIDWLEDQGFYVSKHWPDDAKLSEASQGFLDSLDAVDLVIVGRSVPSSAFDSPDKEYWNALKAPAIYVSPYDVRSSRVNWFNSSSAVHHDTEPDTIWAAIEVASDPIFSGVTLVGDSMDFSIKPHDVLLHPDSIETNGTILATWGDNVMMARFDPWVEFYPGAMDMPAGYRSYFGFGNDHVNSFPNFFPLTENARTVYLAEIDRMLDLPEAPMHITFIVDDDKDSTHIEWLEDQGYYVTTYWPEDAKLSEASQGAIDSLNSADLVIVGRSAPSSAFDSPDKEYWNALKSPQVMVSPYDVRNSRSNWFNSSSAVHHNESPDTIWAAIDMTDDPIFSGVTLVGDSMDFSIKPHDVLLHPDTLETNGTILATWGDNVMMARFDPLEEFYPEAGDQPSGHRSYFGFGNDNVNDFANFFPLTENAKMVYKAEIERLLWLKAAPLSDVASLADLSSDLGALDPVFDPATAAYALEIPKDSTSVMLTAIAKDPNATVTGDGSIAAPGTATITVTADDGSTMEYVVTITLEIDNTGVAPNPVSNIAVYYNSRDDLIQLKNSAEVERIEIYSISGQKLYSMRAHNQESFQINTNMLQRGVFIVRMKLSDNQTHSVKFVK